MKQLLLVIFVSFFLIACSSKKEVVVVNEKQETIKPVKKVDLEKENRIKEFNSQINSSLEDKSLLLKDETVLVDEQFVLKAKESMDIAIVFPSKLLLKYAKSTINTINGYFLYKNMNFKLKVFDSKTQNPEDLSLMLENLKLNGYKKVIALYTKEAVDTFNKVEGLEEFTFYFPLIDKNEIFDSRSNYIFGGISYYDQLVKLMEISSEKKYMFYQNTYIGKVLKEYYDSLVYENSLSVEIKRKNNNFKTLIDNDEIDGTTIFLNTSIIKSSIILSQLVVYDIEPYTVLSTQLNYNPLLISLTQKADRGNFIVANSIDEVDDKLSESISSLGADVIYNWVDYSSLIGVNYLFDENKSGLIKTQIEENVVVYKPRLYSLGDAGFIEIK